MNTSVVRNAARREGKLHECCCSRDDEKWDEQNWEHSINERERERSEDISPTGNPFGVTFGITTKDDIYDAFLLVYGSLSSAAFMSNSGRYPPIFIERVRESKRVRE